jgi:hypothetical protein
LRVQSCSLPPGVAATDELDHGLERIASRLQESNLAIQFRDLSLQQPFLRSDRPGQLGSGILQFGLRVIDLLFGLLRSLVQSLILPRITGCLRWLRASRLPRLQLRLGPSELEGQLNYLVRDPAVLLEERQIRWFAGHLPLNRKLSMPLNGSTQELQNLGRVLQRRRWRLCALRKPTNGEKRAQ